MAKEKGFYKDVGLKVKILPYKSDVDILRNVLTKKATFATGRTSLLIHKNNGYPVVALAAIFQRSPSALLVTNENINSPYDLKIKNHDISRCNNLSIIYVDAL